MVFEAFFYRQVANYLGVGDLRGAGDFDRPFLTGDIDRALTGDPLTGDFDRPLAGDFDCLDGDLDPPFRLGDGEPDPFLLGDPDFLGDLDLDLGDLDLDRRGDLDRERR